MDICKVCQSVQAEKQTDRDCSVSWPIACPSELQTNYSDFVSAFCDGEDMCKIYFYET
jgi:hypothetical protein